MRLRFIIPAIITVLIGVPAFVILWLLLLHPEPTHNYAEDLAIAHESLRPDGAIDARPRIDEAWALLSSETPDVERLNTVLDELAQARWSSEPQLAGESVAEVPFTFRAEPVRVARACLERMREAWERGDAEGVARNLRAVLAMLHVVYRRPSPLIGTVLEAQARETLINALIEHPPGEAVNDAVLDILQSRPERPPVGIAYISDHLYMLDFIQHTYTADPESGVFLPAWSGWDGYLTETPPLLERLGNYRGRQCPRRGDMTRLVNTLFEGLRAIGTEDEPEDLQALVDGFRDGLLQKAPNYTNVWEFGDYDNIPSYGKMIQRNDRDLGGIILMMQLEAYRLEHGSYPEGLDALGVETLTPRGDPWLYMRLAPGADPDGRLYLLYLPGGDGIDNGGVSDGSISSPGGVRDGADWILNKVRRRDG